MNINSIITEAHYFEGFLYISYNGEFFKGCSRCGGTGHYSWNGMDSICYKCGNTAAKLGDAFENEAQAQKWCHERAVRKAQADRKREREAQARVDKMVAKQEALKASDPEVYEFLMAVDDSHGEYTEDGSGYIENKNRERSTFIIDMHNLLCWPANADKAFTPRMLEAIRSTMAARQEKAAAKAALPQLVEGRRQVTGKVISTKISEGYYGDTYKMLIEEESGTRVFGTIPTSILDTVDSIQVLVGWTVSFTAAVEASKDDKSFGFYSRPTKATVAP